MKKILIILMSALFGLSVLQAATLDKVATSKTVKVHITSAKPLSTGSNTFTLTITKDAKALDAQVDVKAFMPAMPGMPAMESKTTATPLKNGKYEATLDLAMGGTWQLHIFILPEKGKKMRVKTSFDF